MRLALVALLGAVGLAVAQPALADGHRPDPGKVAESLCSGPLGAKLGDGCAAKLSGLLASCKAQAPTGYDAFKSCVKAQLPARDENHGGVDPARAAQSLCQGPLGQKLGDGCLDKVTSLLASCKASSSGDGWKQCLKQQLRPQGQDGGFAPGRVAQALCQGPLGQKLGDGCVGRVTSLLAACKAQAAYGSDAFKACVRAQLPAKDGNEGGNQGGFDPARAAQSLCQGPLGQKLGDGCVDRLSALLTSCQAQASSGRDAFKACVRAQLPAESQRQ